MSVNLKELGREWARLAIKHKVEPTTTGNLEHDRACAEEYLRWEGKPPSWYDRDNHGPIFHGQPMREWVPQKQ